MKSGLKGFDQLSKPLILDVNSRVVANSFSNGSPIPALTDSRGNQFVKRDATGPTLETGRFPNTPCLRFINNLLTSTSSQLISPVSGVVSPSVTLIALAQLCFTTTTVNILGGWGFTTSAFTRGFYVFTRKVAFGSSNGLIPYFQDNQNGGAILSGSQIWTPNPNLLQFSRAGSVGQFACDGVFDPSTIVCPSGVGQICNTFAIGGEAADTLQAFSDMALVRLLGYNGVPTTTDYQSIYARFRYEYPELLGWKGGLGATLPPTATKTRVFLYGPGQSNQEARGGLPYNPVTVSGATIIGLDGVRKKLADPISSNTFAITGSNAHQAVPPSPVIGDVSSSDAPAFVNSVLGANPNNPLIVLPTALGSTTTGAWLTGATTNPPQLDALMGFAKLRVLEAKKAPGMVLGGVVIKIGTSDAQSTPVNYQTNMQAIIDDFEAWVVANGIPWEKAIHYYQFTIATNNPGLLPFFAQVNTQIAGVQTNNASKMVTLTISNPVDDPIHLHNSASELNTDGGTKLGPAVNAAV